MNNQPEPGVQPKTYARVRSPHIRHADGLEVGWADMLPPDECL